MEPNQNLQNGASGSQPETEIHSVIRKMLKGIIPGYLFLVFQFKYNNVDFLPDFVGWLLLAAALGRMGKLTSRLIFPKMLAIGAAILTIFDFAGPQGQKIITDASSAHGFYILLYTLLVHLGFFIWVFSWMGRVAAALGNTQLRTNVTVYAVIQIIVMTIIVLSIQGHDMGPLNSPALVLVGFIAHLFMIDYLRTEFGKTVLAENDPEKLKAALADK